MSLREAERRLMPLLPQIIVTSEPTAERLATDFGVQRGASRWSCPGPSRRRAAADRAASACHVLRSGRWCRARGTTCCCAPSPASSISSGASPSRALWTRSRPCPHALGHRGAAGHREQGAVRGRDPDAELEALWRGADLFALATLGRLRDGCRGGAAARLAGRGHRGRRGGIAGADRSRRDLSAGRP